MIHKFVIPETWIVKNDSLNLPTPTLRDSPSVVKWLEEMGITDYHLEWIQNSERSQIGTPRHTRFHFDTAIAFHSKADAMAFKLWGQFYDQ